MTFEQNQLEPEQLEIKAVTGIQDAPTIFTCHCQHTPPFIKGFKADYNASENLCKTFAQTLKARG